MGTYPLVPPLVSNGQSHLNPDHITQRGVRAPDGEDPPSLVFEKPIAEVLDKIEALKSASEENPNLLPQIDELEKEEKKLRKKIFSKLSIWQKVQVARHPNRPHTSDYINSIFTNFIELHGDRQFGDDSSIIGGIGELDSMPIMVIGHEKGRDTKEKVQRNFGMPQPEGYRKAKRLMFLAERFSLPLITFIDTAGAYPGVEGEERGAIVGVDRGGTKTGE